MVDGGIERRVGRDGDSGIGVKASGGEDVNLDARAVEGGIGGGGGAMEDVDGEIGQEGIGGVVESDLLLGHSKLLGDSNHCARSPFGGLVLEASRRNWAADDAGLSTGLPHSRGGP